MLFRFLRSIVLMDSQMLDGRIHVRRRDMGADFIEFVELPFKCRNNLHQAG